MTKATECVAGPACDLVLLCERVLLLKSLGYVVVDQPVGMRGDKQIVVYLGLPARRSFWQRLLFWRKA